MRSYDPTDEYDTKEAARLRAEPWMLELLDINPGYTSWGPHEDYMCDKNAGWRAPMFLATWAERPKLDDLNEVVNFYFSVGRKSVECNACNTGYNPATEAIHNGFYEHLSSKAQCWRYSITQDECDALIASKRAPVGSTAESVNARERIGRGLDTHDAINAHILIRTRAQRLGVYGTCPKCDGHMHVFTEDSARVSLTLWILHPRKGASRGCEIARIERAELPDVFAYLREAAARNAKRFGGVPGFDGATP